MVWAILNPSQNAALSELIKVQHSDRVVAVLGGAILDDSLRRAIEIRFRSVEKGHSDINEKLFKVGGALGNLGPKIDLGFQLYMFEKPIRNAMYGISEIRNLFAHQLDFDFSSTDAKMKVAVSKLVAHVGFTHYPSVLDWSPTEYQLEPTHTVRELFFTNLKIVLLCLMHDSQRHLPWRNEPISPV